MWTPYRGLRRWEERGGGVLTISNAYIMSIFAKSSSPVATPMQKI